MKSEEIITIPFVAHESSMNRMERANKRLVKIIIIELIINILIVAGIMIYFYLPTEVVEDTQNVNNIDNSEVNQKIGE